MSSAPVVVDVLIILYSVVLNFSFIFYMLLESLPKSSSKWKRFRPSIRIDKIIESETDEETRNFLNESLSSPKTPVSTRSKKKSLAELIRRARTTNRMKNIFVQLTKKKKEPTLSEFEYPFNKQEVFKNFDNFDFNVFSIPESPLKYTGLYFIEKHDLLKTIKVPPVTISHLLDQIESKYQTNPYHNSLHAADTLQTAHAIISKSEKISTLLTPLEKFILFLGSLSHDLSHPGKTNRYLMLEYNTLALLHNDRSPLENHHCSELFKILHSPPINLPKYFEENDFRRLRDILIDMILGTDSSNYVKYEDIIRSLLFKNEKKQDSRNDEAKGVLLLLMKCCDISNPIKPPKTCLEWTERVMTEFFEQGDEEQKNGFDVSAFMNRKTTSIAKVQLGFIRYLVNPIYSTLRNYDETNENFENIMVDLQRKIKFWEEVVKLEEQKDETKIELKVDGIKRLEGCFESFCHRNKFDSELIQ